MKHAHLCHFQSIFFLNFVSLRLAAVLFLLFNQEFRPLLYAKSNPKFRSIYAFLEVVLTLEKQ